MAVACGDFHTAAVTKDAGLYTWGSGGEGGLTSLKHRLVPTSVPSASSWSLLGWSRKFQPLLHQMGQYGCGVQVKAAIRTIHTGRLPKATCWQD